MTHTFETCQWPFGDPHDKDFHFCEAKTLEGKPYCKEHCDIAYVGMVIPQQINKLEAHLKQFHPEDADKEYEMETPMAMEIKEITEISTWITV